MTETNLGESVSWWSGVVVDIKDPHESGRVRVRVTGRQDDETLIPDESLTWDLVLQPPTSAALGKMGSAPVGLVKGSRVIGLWLDTDHQQKLVLGTIGKSGDVIEGSMEDGAPKVDISLGSIPGPAQASEPHPYNPYSSLFDGRVSIADIDSGKANIFSVKNTIGSIVTKDVESDMYFAKVPTIASNPRGSSSKIFPLLAQIDPSSKGAAIKCHPSAQMFFEQLIGSFMNAVTSIAKGLLNSVVAAMKNAILRLAQQIGLFKILKMLNDAAKKVANITSMMDKLLFGKCGKSSLNDGSSSPTEIAIASALHDLNQQAGYVHDVTQKLSSQTANVMYKTIATPPPSNVSKINSPIPPLALIVTTDEVPANYTQNYHTHDADPFPGYIEWDSPFDPGVMVYTKRDGQPNYTSATQHTEYSVQDQFTKQLSTAISTAGSAASAATSNFLTTAVSGTISFAKDFATSALLGNGLTGLDPSALLSSAQSIISDVTQSIQNAITGITKAIANFTISATFDPLTALGLLKLFNQLKSIINLPKYIMAQINMALKKQTLRTALTKDASSASMS